MGGEGSETEWSVKSRCQNYLQVIKLEVQLEQAR